MLRVDLNCDMGEGIGKDADLMPWISSANIACGAHAGDIDMMKRTIELAIKHKVAIGAHPGFDDKANFGRTEMQLDGEAIIDLICTQVQQLQTLSKEQGASLTHIKPHGALYNMAAKDPELASNICQAILALDTSLIFYGLAGSVMIDLAKKHSLKTCNEVFADRTYQDDGSLTPRSEAGALIMKDEDALLQVLKIVKYGKVISQSGKEISLAAETICVHGDGAHAVSFAKKINTALRENGIHIIHPGKTIS